MKKAAIILTVSVLYAGAALAQKPPTESVTVTGEKTREAVDKFVKSVRTPTRITGKTARWRTPICPMSSACSPRPWLT